MRLVQSLVLGNNALLALEHLVQVLELVHEEDGLVTHYRIDCVQGLNRQIKVTFMLSHSKLKGNNVPYALEEPLEAAQGSVECGYSTKRRAQRR